MFKKGFVLTCMLFLAVMLVLPSCALASVGIKVDTSAGTSGGGVEELGNATYLEFSGPSGVERKGNTFVIPVVDQTLAAAGIANGGSTSMTSTDLAVPVTFATVKKAIANDSAFTAGTLADGKQGQMLSFEITEQLGSEVFVITPATSTYFQTASFNAVGDKAIFWFVDITNGWQIVSSTSVTVVLP